MKETLGNLAYVEESANEEGSVNSDAEKDRRGANKDSASTKDQNLSGSSNANNVNDQLTLTNNTNQQTLSPSKRKTQLLQELRVI